MGTTFVVQKIDLLTSFIPDCCLEEMKLVSFFLAIIISIWVYLTVKERMEPIVLFRSSRGICLFNIMVFI